MINYAMRQTCYRRPLLITLAVILVLCLIWLLNPPYNSFSWRDVPPKSSSQRIAKVSMLYGKPNQLYERALQSHARHAKRWGYHMHILREDISVGFWNKPSYLLSLVIQELAKSHRKRVQWLLWVDADSIILNGAIPASLFIPPRHLEDIHIVATKDHNGLNTGIMFLHVHSWTISMLIESLAYPLFYPNETLGRSVDQESMARVLNKTTGGPDGKGYKDGLIYVPRTWINTYEWMHAYEGKRGNLLVHFPGLEEHRWSHMSKWLDIVETTPTRWEVPLENTQYPNETTAFWKRVGMAIETMALMDRKIQSMPNSTDSQRGEIQTIDGAVRGLRKVLHEQADNELVIQRQLDNLNMLR